MAVALSLALFLLAGCQSLDRLTTGTEGSRSDVYEPAVPSQPPARLEPYAVFMGYYKTGERLYLIHWTGNGLDKTGLVESSVDAISIPKYSNE